MDERDRPVYAFIPPNLSQNGGLWGGLIKGRNLIEAAVGCGLLIFIFRILGIFLPFIPVLIAAAVSIVLMLVVTLMGVQGEPFSVFVLNVINYKKTAGFVGIRPPMPIQHSDKAIRRKEKGRIEKWFEYLMYGKN